jgi:hypothetical protein
MAPMNSRERRLLKKALSRSRECATLEELSALTGGSLPSASVARVAAHVGSCPRCKTELDLMEKFESAEPGAGEEATVRWISTRLERRVPSREAASASARSEPWWRRFITAPALGRAGFALSVAMLVVAASFGLWNRRAPGLIPSSGDEGVFRSDAVTGMSPTGDVDRIPSELRWDPLPAAASYFVRVMEVDRVELWSAETREPRVELPAAIQARVVPGKPLLWEVTAKDAAGLPLASSAARRFRLPPRESRP